ncbi:MAG: 2,3-bisphosphoglycerate-independent phosphoglycerate mutase [Acidobacteria bacterium]|nr:2,3-bisphosphoglycerate-independent phosphoglycerate mutase [Acidobacteriota bacterium]
MHSHKAILVIMDGHGIAPAGPGNAVTTADTPNLDRLYRKFPTSRLQASGLFVGLPDGQMGNSEVGHLNLGAGRVVYQDITRIDKAIKDGSFTQNPALKHAFESARKTGSRVHMLGLLSDGGVHSHIRHLKALLEMAKKADVPGVTVHAFMDGRDTPPDSGIGYIEDLDSFIRNLGFGEIGTVTGRYYAMDRDNRWERIQLAYDALVNGKGRKTATAEDAVKTAYAAGETDEFIKPVVIEGSHSISEGDVVLFFNFRSDRARQMCHALLDDEFSHFERKKLQFTDFVTFTEYEAGLPVSIAFPPETLKGLYGEAVSDAGLKQLRIAETEKYAHVTFFFNGGEEKSFPGEERILVPSPKVATYDLQPEMSAFEVADRVVDAIESGRFQAIVLNFANCDMVGHTGVFDAAVKAVETVDTCVGKVADSVLKNGWDMLLTADHGNAEKMLDENGGPFTAHTTNPVPLCLISERFRRAELNEGSLRDIAPTLLFMLEVKQPDEMTGKSLIE